MINKDLIITTKDLVEREQISIKRYGDNNSLLLSYANVKFVISKTDLLDAILAIDEFYGNEITQEIEIKPNDKQVDPENLQVFYGDEEN